MPEIRRISSKTHIPDNEAFCCGLIDLVSDEDYLNAKSIALIAKDEVIVKVLVEKLRGLGLEPKKITEIVHIHSLQPLATRLIQLAFNVENELPDGDEILPKLLAKHGQFDVLIGNPPIKSKDNDRNNTWVDKIVDSITGDNSPLKEDGVVAISLPVKHEVVERLKKIHLTTMTTGMERHFPGTPARHNYHLRNNQPSEEGELEILTHEGVSKTISITEMKYFGKTADVELSMLLNKVIQYNQLFSPQNTGGFHSESDRTKKTETDLLYVRNGLPKRKGHSQLLCCVDVETTKKHEYCSKMAFVYDPEKHVKVWDWGKTGKTGHHTCRIVNKDQTTEEKLIESGYGVKKVVWKNKSVSPWSPHTTAIKYDQDGVYITNENSIFYRVNDDDEAERIIAYLKTNFFKELISKEFKTDKYWSLKICVVPNISPMTDEKLAEEFDLSPRLRAMIGL